MLIDELIKELEKKTNQKITFASIGRALNVDRSAVSARAKRKGELKQSEIDRINEYFGVPQLQNTLNRQNDETVFDRASQLGKRLSEIQDKHNFLDSEMAKMLKISEKDYMKIKLGKLQPDLDVLNEIKRNFVVDIDWLIYG